MKKVLFISALLPGDFGGQPFYVIDHSGSSYPVYCSGTASAELINKILGSIKFSAKSNVGGN